MEEEKERKRKSKKEKERKRKQKRERKSRERERAERLVVAHHIILVVEALSEPLHHLLPDPNTFGEKISEGGERQ